MLFFRTYGGLIAAIVVAAMGAVMLPAAFLLGVVGVAAGAGMASWWGWRLFQARRDPYDLKRLWDMPPEPVDEADEGAIEDDGTLYCHRCGHSVPYPLRICPECGNPLG